MVKKKKEADSSFNFGPDLPHQDEPNICYAIYIYYIIFSTTLLGWFYYLWKFYIHGN